MGMNVPYRRLAQVAEWSLLAIVVLLHVAGWVWREAIANAGPLAAIVADSLPLASALLLALWLALGPGTPWLRGGAAALLVAIVISATDFRTYYRWVPGDWLLGLAPLATFACAGLMRACGLKVLNCQFERERPGGATFTVRSLLVITTAIAVVIGGLESFRPWLHSSTRPAISNAELDAILGPNNLRIALMCVVFTAISLLTCASVLRAGTIWLRLAGLALLILAAGWYIGHLTDTDSESTLTLTLWAGTTVAILAASLLPLRLMGYRLHRCPTLRVGHVLGKTMAIPLAAADQRLQSPLAHTECGPTYPPAEVHS
ncbi:MAG: hypothetical protein L0211_15535 [Planctomycetaceae bacterium]|nr:hypothetical protein [Planctomycetaceae bacterium]